jgi:hypothetical protein
VHTNASVYAIGSVLTQPGNLRVDYPIYFASRSLSPAETRYTTTELELLAVVWSVNKFHHHLFGTSFDLYTDHSALKWLLTTASLKDTKGRLIRWIVQLQNYNFTPYYKRGTKNQNADALSRLGH